jgi:hypothetical protein
MEIFPSKVKKSPKFFKGSGSYKRSDIVTDDLFFRIKSGFPLNKIRNAIDEEQGTAVRKYLEQFVDLTSGKTLITKTSSRFNILRLSDEKYDAIVNLKKINRFRWINKFFEKVNENLSSGGIYVDDSKAYLTGQSFKYCPKTLFFSSTSYIHNSRFDKIIYLQCMFESYNFMPCKRSWCKWY